MKQFTAAEKASLLNPLSDMLYRIGLAMAAGTAKPDMVDPVLKALQVLKDALTVPVVDLMNPQTATEYAAVMTSGGQAGDFLEMPDLAAQAQYSIDLSDMQRMRTVGWDHLRIPFCSSARSSLAGTVSAFGLKQIRDQVAAAKTAGFPRVIIDFNHHEMGPRGQLTANYAQHFDAGTALLGLTQAQHIDRLVARTKHMAVEFNDMDLTVAFDLVNEPGVGVSATGWTEETYHAALARMATAIRNTGGNNAKRTLVVEPFSTLKRMVLPANIGPVIVSPHCYEPSSYTHSGAALTAGGMAIFVAMMKSYAEYARTTSIPVWVGEMGTKVTASDRPEYLAFIRATCLALKVPGCYWAYRNDFALVDKVTKKWLPNIEAALLGNVAVRSVPDLLPLNGGRIASLQANPNYARMCTLTADGFFSAPLNTTGYDAVVMLAFPNILATAGQSWAAYVTDIVSGSFGLAPLPLGPGDTRPGYAAKTGGFYPWKQNAPGGAVVSFEGLKLNAPSYLGIEVNIPAGQSVTQARLAAVRVV